MCLLFICLRPRTPYPSFTHCTYTCIQYTYSHWEGGRGQSWTREKVREATVHKAGSKIPTRLTVQYLQSINSDKHLPQSSFTGQIKMTTFCFSVYKVKKSVLLLFRASVIFTSQPLESYPIKRAGASLVFLLFTGAAYRAERWAYSHRIRISKINEQGRQICSNFSGTYSQAVHGRNVCKIKNKVVKFFPSSLGLIHRLSMEKLCARSIRKVVTNQIPLVFLSYWREWPAKLREWDMRLSIE